MKKLPLPDAITVVAVLAALIVLAIWSWNFDPFGRRKAAEGRAESAGIQASANASGQHIEARRSTNTRKAQQSAEEGRDAVQKSNDLDAALAAWGDAVDRVRDAGKLPVSGPDGS